MPRMTPLLMLLGLFLFSLTPIHALECRDQNSAKNTTIEVVTPEKPVYSGKGGQTFVGHLRVYVIEPTGRWKDATNRPFEYAFLDFAVNQSISIPYEDTYTVNATWDGSTAVYNNPEDNFGDITEGNIMVIAAVFDSIPRDAFSKPPGSDHFITYYCDAAASATPGNPGTNTITEGFTHTVFIEEAATPT